MRRQSMLLTAWLTAPILVVGLLCYWIVASLQAGPVMDAEPVGAGAGETGGANAIGELLSERRSDARVVLVVEDRTGSATPDRPLMIGLAGNGWSGEAMTPAGDGRWTWTGPARALGEGFDLFWTDRDGTVHRDADGRRGLLISAGEQVERLERFGR